MHGDNDLAGAARHFERALAFDPNDLDVLGNSAVLLQSLGRLDEALALDETVVRRDPVNVTALFNLGYHQRMGQQRQRKQCRQARFQAHCRQKTGTK